MFLSCRQFSNTNIHCIKCIFIEKLRWKDDFTMSLKYINNIKMQIYARRSQTMANYIACITQRFKVYDILTYTAILYLFRPYLFRVSLFSVRPELTLIEWENSHPLHAWLYF
jgi:hypothetical protein